MRMARPSPPHARLALGPFLAPVLAPLLALTAASCAPVAVGEQTSPVAAAPADAECVDASCFLLTSERSTPAQKEAARALIVAEFADVGITAELRPYDAADYGIKSRAGTQGVNVVGVLPATMSTHGATERHIVLGAHYDTVPGSPGVDDNGSGVQILFAVARHLAAMPERTATVHFVLFDQEELGLVGAGVNAERWRRGAVPLESMHNIDMIGWDSDDDGVIEFDSNSPEITALYQEMAADLPVSLLVTTYPNTDHQPYRARGFTVASISEEFEDNSQNPAYHTPQDTAVQPDYFGASLKLMVRVFERLVS